MKFLVLSAHTGMGHTQAANAIQDALYKRYETKHIDLLDYTNRLYKYFYSKLYIQLLHIAPTVMYWLYNNLNYIECNTRSRANFNTRIASPLLKYIQSYKPDVIICTHFLAAEIVATFKKRGLIKAKHAVVVTDFDAHAVWVYPEVDCYFVALEETKQHLHSYGIDESKIQVSGIPIHHVQTYNTIRKYDLLQKYGLKDMCTILVSSGGYGVGSLRELVTQLMKVSNIQVIVVCGKNKQLELTLLKLTKGLDFLILGYTYKMYELMTIADLFIGKPGGITTSECMAHGLPMVVFEPIPGQEEFNADHLLEAGVAIRCNHLLTVPYKVSKLLNDTRKLARMRQNAHNFARPEAASCIAERCISLGLDV